MKQSRLGILVGIGAITIGASLSAFAPAAHAEPISENTIKQECKQANGSYSSANLGGGVRWSGCTYKAADGNTYTDNYNNGTYSGTNQIPGGRPRPA
jgi:hypothetical protein